ncbi:transcriptional regulator [Streptomyces ruber]|uniref:Glycerol operon regulatory protein n=2 Tax=Streptomyces TaxID=1883 RepID=A0A918BKF8_9ACTN|nr:helix-turn-helix domain-containing protein [Streptomyces ruber]GGQ73923.1 transcriptional regulator [Streptomyces ruber]
MATVDPTPEPPDKAPSVPAEPSSTTLIGSVQRAVRLLEAVAEREHGAPAKQLARDAGLALPTAYHLLRTLTHEGYLHRDKGLFFLGEAAERLRSRSTQQKRRITMSEALAHWRDAIGAPVHVAVYDEGEIEIMSIADGPVRPTAEERDGHREAGDTHAIGQCLLSQLCEEIKRDQPDRCLVPTETPPTVCDDHSLPRRPDKAERRERVVEQQEHVFGTVCAAVPVTFGTTTATMAVSVPLHQADRLLPAVRKLQDEVGRLPGSLALSISI